MELRYLRIKAFYAAMNGFSRRARRVRMDQMVQRMQLRPGQRVLDLGGLAETWREAPGPLDLTVLNLPGTQMKSEGLQHRVTYVEGDACDVAGVPDRSFDVVFSNSVIEHVGNDEQQQAFAREVRQVLLGTNTVRLVPDRGTHRHALLVVLPRVAAWSSDARLATETARVDGDGARHACAEARSRAVAVSRGSDLCREVGRHPQVLHRVALHERLSANLRHSKGLSGSSW
jgi:hypothetical protein